MKNNNINIDQLIDSAIAKDRAKIPPVPKQPNPSSFYGKNAARSAESGIGNTNAIRSRSKNATKILIAILALISIGAVSFFIFSSGNQNTVPSEKSRTSHQVIISPDTLQKGEGSSLAKVNKTEIAIHHPKKANKITKIRQHWE